MAVPLSPEFILAWIARWVTAGLDRLETFYSMCDCDMAIRIDRTLGVGVASSARQINNRDIAVRSPERGSDNFRVIPRRLLLEKPGFLPMDSRQRSRSWITTLPSY
jgi:hypothetical protein